MKINKETALKTYLLVVGIGIAVITVLAVLNH